MYPVIPLEQGRVIKHWIAMGVAEVVDNRLWFDEFVRLLTKDYLTMREDTTSIAKLRILQGGVVTALTTANPTPLATERLLNEDYSEYLKCNPIPEALAIILADEGYDALLKLTEDIHKTTEFAKFSAINDCLELLFPPGSLPASKDRIVHNIIADYYVTRKELARKASLITNSSVI